MSNFNFLEKIDNDLYKIISDAEKLFRDEYFEQSIIQSRRFAETICRNLLNDTSTDDSTFDECLATLQDSYTKNIRQKEVISDLYFLKSQGNASVHSKKVVHDANIAIDCLKRAFELAINYALITGHDSTLEKLEFSEDALVLGTKEKKKTLKDKYTAKKKQAKKNNLLYKKKKEKVGKYVYPSLVENPKAAMKFNFIGLIILLALLALYIYISFFKS